STLTIIGAPAISYADNLTFIQLVFGYLIGRVLIVLVLLPGYFRGELLTAYALIEKRFGEKMRAVAATTFLVTRAIAEGVRVSAIALVVSVVLGTSERLAVVIVISLPILYTFEGGMKSTRQRPCAPDQRRYCSRSIHYFSVDWCAALRICAAHATSLSRR